MRGTQAQTFGQVRKATTSENYEARRFRAAGALSRPAFAGFFFAAVTAPRLFRRASIKSTTGAGDATSAATMSWPAIFDWIISRSASV